MQLHETLPTHPTAVYPAWHDLAGHAVRALHVDRHGRLRFPMLGGAPDDDPPGGGGDGGGSAGGDGGDAGGSGGAGGSGAGGSGAGGSGGGSGSGDGGDAGSGGAGGGDKGFPDGVRWQDMTDTEQAAYWRHQSQKHQGRYKNLVGDRSYDDVKKDLDEYAEVKKSQQTPAEQALTERYQQGRSDATSEANTKAATAILTANLQSAELTDDEIEEIVTPIDFSKFVNDDGDIDTARLATFASRFTSAGTANGRERGRPDFGGGRRPRPEAPRGSRGKAEAEKRFGKKKTDDD